MVVNSSATNEERATLHQAIQAIIQGQVLLYPTETLYALGANALNHQAVARVCRIKGRAENKPLPVIIGSMDQLRLVGRNIAQEVINLAGAFWPGPLSIVIPAHGQISPQAQDETGCTSVRWSSHPLAQKLCVQSGVPLVGTSANLAGGQPASRPKDLDSGLVQAADGIVTGPPYPRGGLPSTVVRVVGPKQIKVIRVGAVSAGALRDAGWVIQEGL